MYEAVLPIDELNHFQTLSTTCPPSVVLHISYPRMGSMPAVGSSRTRSGGALITAAANDTRRFSPPLKKSKIYKDVVIL